MFNAARAVIGAQGVTISLEEINLDKLINDADVPRSAAYRMWPYKGEFVTDLLMNYAGPQWVGTAAFDLSTMLEAGEVALAHWARLTDLESRRSVTVEIVRRAVARNFDGISSSADWNIFAALVATAKGNSNEVTRQNLAAELQTAEMGFLDEMQNFYAAMAYALGFRLRGPDLTYRQLAAAGASIVEGLALRRILVEANRTNPRVKPAEWSLEDLINSPIPGPGLENDTEDWSLAAWTFLGVLDQFIEPDPNWAATEEKREALEHIVEQARAELAQVEKTLSGLDLPEDPADQR